MNNNNKSTSSIIDSRYKQLPTLNESEEDYNDRRTESSSSWTDDEFELEAASQIQELFNGVEAFLYEDDPSKIQPSLSEELTQWKETFPHLRVVGTQIKPSNRKSESEDFFVLNESSDCDKFDSFYKQIIEDLSNHKIGGTMSSRPSTSTTKKRKSKKSYNRLSILPSLRNITSAPLVREKEKSLPSSSREGRKESIMKDLTPSSKKDVILPPIIQKTAGINRNTIQRRTFPDRKLSLRNPF